jgi:hypothetical protein
MSLPDEPQRLQRVLSRRDLIFYGGVAVTPSAPDTIFGLAEVKSRGDSSLQGKNLGKYALAEDQAGTMREGSNCTLMSRD